jgi:hypothetical protein
MKVKMKVKGSYITPLLSAAAAALAIAAAPSALAAPSEQPCSDMGGTTECQRTSNVQIYAKPHDMQVTPRTAYGPFEGFHAGHN